MSVNDSIEIVSFDPSWPEKARQEMEALRLIFDPLQFPVMEHVGSTAIPDLDAKPIIDILIACGNLENGRTRIPAMQQLGYVFWQDPSDQDHLFFVKGMPPYGAGRTHHVHMHPLGHPDINNKISFRDRLRNRPDLTRDYQELKYKLAAQFKNDREGHTDAKTDFIKHVLDNDNVI